MTAGVQQALRGLQVVAKDLPFKTSSMYILVCNMFKTSLLVYTGIHVMRYRMHFGVCYNTTAYMHTEVQRL